MIRWIPSLLFFAAAVAVANESDQEKHEESAHSGHGRYALAVFVGGTAVDEGSEFTLGIEGGMHLSERWSIGAVIERAERNQHSTLFLVGVGWHPFGPGFRAQLGVGRKDPRGKQENVLRAGFAWEAEIDNGWFVKPYLAQDFIENEDSETVYGVYIGRTF